MHKPSEPTHDLLDKLYAVALEPERFSELVEIWQAALDESAAADPVVAQWRTTFTQHVQRADAILAIADQQADDEPLALQRRLDAEAQAMLAVAGSGAIVAANPAARLRYGLSEGGRLKDLPLEPGAIERLHEAVRRLLRTAVPDPVPTGSATIAPASPTLLRLSRVAADGSLFVALAPWVTPAGERLALLKTTDFSWPDALTPLVARAFGLTEAEGEVMRMMVEGASVEEVAKARHRSLATVRSQIRSIYDKTATRSQAEFIRLAVGLTTLQLEGRADNRTAQPSPVAVARFHPLPDHRRILTLPDGRRLDYADFGAPDGRPCLYFHNEYFADLWPVGMAEAAAAGGLRIIAPARPSYGRSSPYPPGAVNYQQVTADQQFLLDHLGLDRVVLTAQTFGAMFALALAVAAPTRVAGFVPVAPAFPHGAPEDEAAMPLFFRFMSSVVLRHPEMLGFAVRTGASYVRRIGWQRFLERIFRHAPVDLAVIGDPANAEALERAFEFSSAQGHQSVTGDYSAVLPDPWRALLKLHVPLYAVIGSDDRNSRAQRADRLIAAGADIRKIVADGGGQLLFFTHPQLIVDTLVRAWHDAGQHEP